MAKEKPYPTEAALCAAFIDAVPKGWTPYAETAGYRITGEGRRALEGKR